MVFAENGGYGVDRGGVGGAAFTVEVMGESESGVGV
jgi:hypothetical protein